MNVILEPFQDGGTTEAASEPREYKYIKCFHRNQTIKTVQNSFPERGIKTMHLRMGTRPLPLPHLIRLLWCTQMAGAEEETRLRDGWM